MVVRLAWRSLWRNKRRTLITITSIVMGLIIAIFFIAMAEGVYYQVVNEGVRMQAGHITLENPGYQTAPAIDLRIGDVEKIRNRIEGIGASSRLNCSFGGKVWSIRVPVRWVYR